MIMLLHSIDTIVVYSSQCKGLKAMHIPTRTVAFTNFEKNSLSLLENYRCLESVHKTKKTVPNKDFEPKVVKKKKLNTEFLF